jgi:hypothetical protein
MFTNFMPRPNMLAHELTHFALAPIPLHIATMVTAELGAPSFRRGNDTAWYADAHINLDDGSHVSCPFALRIDHNGNASMQIRWQEQDLMAHAIASLVPHITIEPVRPRGEKRAA